MLTGGRVVDLVCEPRGLPQTLRLFAVVEAASGSYVQAGGAADVLVVEARLMKAGGAFVHVTAGRKGERRPLRSVPMSGGGVRAPGHEVLAAEDAARIMAEFLEAGTLSTEYAWRDKTAEFR